MKEIIITENLEAINSLKFIKEQLLQLPNDSYRWKWIILSLHSSLQNFMVCVLLGSNNLDVLTRKTSVKLLSEFLNRMKVNVSEWSSTEERLDSFSNLYQKIQSDRMLKSIISNKFEPTESQNYYVKMIDYLRNKFSHFIPMVWSLSIIKLPDLSIEIIKIISFLAYESGNFRWKNISQKEDTQKLLSEIKELLEKLTLEYAKLNHAS